MQAPHRIYLVGAHATGKTTLARWIRDTYGIAMISEVARGVLAEMEARLDALRSDVDLVNRYQKAVFERQLAIEAAQAGSFVSDRAFCNLAYAAQHATILPEIFRDPRLAQYMESVRSGLVFFLRPHETLLTEDGVREKPDWEEVLRIDGMVKLLLEMFDVPYVPVASLSMQERIRGVGRVLDLAGLHPSSASQGNGNGNGHGRGVGGAVDVSSHAARTASRERTARETASPRDPLSSSAVYELS